MTNRMQEYRPKLMTVVMLLAAALWLAPLAAIAAEGPRTIAPAKDSNGLVMGVGLVVGLPGTGDSEVDQKLVEKSIVGILKRAGLDLWRGQIEPGRIAKVIVTAELPAGSKDGMRVAVSVTAIGDASSLAGGVLLVTSLRDPDGKVYAIGQGRVEVDNQVAGAEQPEIAARVGVLAEGAVLDSEHPQEVAIE